MKAVKPSGNAALQEIGPQKVYDVMQNVHTLAAIASLLA